MLVSIRIQPRFLQRAKIPQVQRRPYQLYVDEFQNYATMSFVRMLSEARKYKLFLTMAEHSSAQQEQQRMVDIILANVGTTICFRTGSPADEIKLLPLFEPHIKEGELANLPAYNFYVRIAAIDAQEPFSGRTIILDSSANVYNHDLVVESSRRVYAVQVHDNPRAPASGLAIAKHSRSKKTSQKGIELVT